MKRYCVKSRPGKQEYIDILSENDEGYNVRLIMIVDGDEKIREEFMQRSLFEMCLNTGYMFEMVEEELNCSAA